MTDRAKVERLLERLRERRPMVLHGSALSSPTIILTEAERAKICDAIESFLRPEPATCFECNGPLSPYCPRCNAGGIAPQPAADAGLETTVEALKFIASHKGKTMLDPLGYSPDRRFEAGAAEAFAELGSIAEAALAARLLSRFPQWEAVDLETTAEERARWRDLLTRDLASINRMTSLPREQAVKLIDDIDRLLRQSGGWRDMASAPKDGTAILAWDGEFQVVIVWSTHSKTWFTLDGGVGYEDWDSPTHWHPLPLPPEPAKSEEKE